MVLPSSMTNFPSKLPHGSGRMMALDRKRLLLAFKKPHEREDVEGFLQSTNTGLVLEDFDKSTKWKLLKQRERINHTRVFDPGLCGGLGRLHIMSA
jgi:hypothetical protein